MFKTGAIVEAQVTFCAVRDGRSYNEDGRPPSSRSKMKILVRELLLQDQSFAMVSAIRPFS